MARKVVENNGKCRLSPPDNNQNGVTHKPPQFQEKNGNSAVSAHANTLDAFYRENPQFVWGPLLMVAFMYGLNRIPKVAAYISRNDMKLYGFGDAFQYTFFAISLSYAFHGFCATHCAQEKKIQSGRPYQSSVAVMSTRSNATLVTELVYTFLPLSPVSSSWFHFCAWTAAFAIYWDLHFYVAHRWAHQNMWAYRFFHKMHHLCKEPNCFGAYFVEYQSHILLEQMVVLIMAFAGLPKDVFNFYMYWGTLGTYIEHSGYDFGSMRLPIIGVTFGQVCKLFNIPTFFLDGVNAAEHDWHHEKFTCNYSLSFKYLDKMLGTYHTGRCPGEQTEEFDPCSSTVQ